MRRHVVLAFAVLVCLCLLAPVAQGYIGQAPVQILMSGPTGPVRCGTTVSISATVLGSQDGKPIEEQVVQWGLSGSASKADRLGRSKTTTDANGTARVDLLLGSDTGSRKVTASVTIVDASIVVTCVRRLPQTSLERPGGLADQPTADVPMADVPLSAAPAVGQPAVLITIPRLGITAPIVEGDGVDVPTQAVAHYPGSAWPGGGSNVFLYGHARAGLFGDLWRIRTHDMVDVTLASGTVARYEVTRIVPVARSDDLGYLAATDGEQLTLQTCLWYDEDSPRFIVIARPLPASP
jgi:sortase A